MLKYLVYLFLICGKWNVSVLTEIDLTTTSRSTTTGRTTSGVPLGKFHYSPKSLLKSGYIVDITVFDSHMCLGALVLPSWVVTVGRCVNVTGSLTFLAFIQRKNGEMLYREINYMKVHNSYLRQPRRFDIALLNLKKRFNINLSEVVVMARTKIGYRSCEVYTLDKNSSKIYSYPTTLVSNEECSKQYKEFLVDTSIVCSTVSGTKTCVDSMGSLLVCNKRLLGLSLDVYHCHSKKPMVYTSLAFFHPWVENYIQQLDPTAFSHAFSNQLSCGSFSFVLFYTYLNEIVWNIFLRYRYLALSNRK